MHKAVALHFASREEWREWLARNHESSDGAWLFIHKKGSTGRGLRYEEAVEESLCFGWIDSRVRAHDHDRYVQWYSPRKDGSVLSELNKGRVARLAKEGRMTEAGLGRVRVAKRKGTWAALPRRSDDPRPPGDLLEALRKDQAAWRGWKALAPSYRRMYIYWVDATPSGPRRGRGGSARS